MLYFPLSFERPGRLTVKNMLFSAEIRVCPFISETSMPLTCYAEATFKSKAASFFAGITVFPEPIGSLI